MLITLAMNFVSSAQSAGSIGCYKQGISDLVSMSQTLTISALTRLARWFNLCAFESELIFS